MDMVTMINYFCINNCVNNNIFIFDLLDLLSNIFQPGFINLSSNVIIMMSG